MDITSGVSAFATFEGHLQGDISFLGLHRFVAERSLSVNTTCTTYVQFTFGLGVKVQQVLTFEPSALQVVGTVHTGLFINSEERLKRRMYRILVRQNGHSCCYAYTVVCSQRCTVCRHPLTVIFNICLDGVFFKIKDLVAVLLRHHIHVSLKDHARMVFITRRSWFANEDITNLVLKSFQS